MNYWLFKSEPDSYSIDDLKQAKTDHWDGVRNYQARNIMRDEMKKGDLAYFYHSNCDEPGIVGIMVVAKEAYPDFTALDPTSKYYDAKSNADNPRWFMVDVRYKRKTKRKITLSELKNQQALENFALTRKGNRLSVIPMTKKEWEFILNMEKSEN